MKSGDTHVIYDHFHFPRLLELKCSNCSSKSIATNENVPIEIEHFIDIADFNRTWEYKCVTCIKKQDLNWEELKAFELWNKIEIGNETVWAWNAKHLELILMCLRKRSTKNHPWQYFVNYLPKKWLQKIKKESDFKKIELLLP